jgi:hypothetical protein
VLLSLQLAETARAIAAIERLRGHFGASLPLGCAEGNPAGAKLTHPR